MRTRRVGSITCGSMMIIFGILFLAHMIYPALSFSFVLKLWPMILIALGAEMIIANLHHSSKEAEILQYDKGAIIITFLLFCFALAMGFVEYCMEYGTRYGHIYIN